jgi:hypothetical protein
MTTPTTLAMGLHLEADGEVVHANPELWDENGNLKEEVSK